VCPVPPPPPPTHTHAKPLNLPQATLTIFPQDLGNKVTSAAGSHADPIAEANQIWPLKVFVVCSRGYGSCEIQNISFGSRSVNPCASIPTSFDTVNNYQTT
jgi:hypothetical protein